MKPLQKVSVMEGDSAVLVCEVANVSGDMPITWLKDGKPLTAKPSEIEMMAEGPVLSLRLPATVLDDEAEYTIIVGKTQSKAELLVDGQ